jgi:hypothetical protein
MVSTGVVAAIDWGARHIGESPLLTAAALTGGAVLDEIEKPVQGIAGLATLAATRNPQQAASVARMPQEQIAQEAGGLVTDKVAQAGYPRVAPVAGAAVNTTINMAGI